MPPRAFLDKSREWKKKQIITDITVSYFDHENDHEILKVLILLGF